MKRLTWFMSILFLMVLPTAAAQEHSSPLLDLLALAPDNEFARSDVVYYQDFRAVENARDYLSRPESGAAFLASDPSLGFTQRWYAAPIKCEAAFSLF